MNPSVSEKQEEAREAAKAVLNEFEKPIVSVEGEVYVNVKALHIASTRIVLTALLHCAAGDVGASKAYAEAALVLTSIALEAIGRN